MKLNNKEKSLPSQVLFPQHIEMDFRRRVYTLNPHNEITLHGVNLKFILSKPLNATVPRLWHV